MVVVIVVVVVVVIVVVVVDHKLINCHAEHFANLTALSELKRELTHLVVISDVEA